MKPFVYGLLTAIGLSLSNVTIANQWQAQSPEHVVGVLELFTAEGCGLCPAAYQFVDSLPAQGILSSQLIVLEFHVDYLDERKGWQDRFAQPVFTARQNQLAQLNRYQHIYTPEFVLSGETIHSWRDQLIEVIHFLADHSAEADLNMAIKRHNDMLDVQIGVTVRGDENKKASKLYLAIKEKNVSSKVEGGDNAGQNFTYQHVVRDWIGPFELDLQGESRINYQTLINNDWQADNLTLVAIVQNLSDGYVLQGLEVPLNEFD